MPTDREKLWMASHAIITGLRPKFGTFMGIDLADKALRISYDNIMDSNKLTDTEIEKVVIDLKRIING
jgi:hypothetical protein